jgi:hypothetical protein
MKAATLTKFLTSDPKLNLLLDLPGLGRDTQRFTFPLALLPVSGTCSVIRRWLPLNFMLNLRSFARIFIGDSPLVRSLHHPCFPIATNRQHAETSRKPAATNRKQAVMLHELPYPSDGWLRSALFYHLQLARLNTL